MLEATSTLMVEMQEKITLSLRMMSSLIEMTTLSKHHIQLNNTTVHWLKRIRPIFERSASMYEQMKFELEEKLQEEVVILDTHVQDMFPRYVNFYSSFFSNITVKDFICVVFGFGKFSMQTSLYRI
jgi:hypothetical protein